MVECSFKYTHDLLAKISKASTKNMDLFSEIAMFIILVGSVVMFIIGNTLLGIIFSVIFIALL
ncbi:MAG: hypothetical protein J6Q15_03500, partial [Clostridia bacterium]|nr:hypothetical protein [Clostridia bacterium]